MVEVTAEIGGFLRRKGVGGWVVGVKIRLTIPATPRNHNVTNVKLVINLDVTKLRSGAFFVLFLRILVVG
ncbi:hypothetical protein H8I69_08180 [Serratia fonticola]|uniref:hypothetical protein n=1 Tax=Serratia fonticola TaxID=47917 RepID=UPI0015C5F0FD|nr:hypothetical protein [Serratia fonticola]MBC3379084.1 hypothetical protein [Serratia fonticola]NYA38284.1 hypothetical protein [Serratia fonticola]